MNGKFARAFWPLLLLVDLLVIGGGIFLLFSGRDYSVAQKQNSSLIGLSYMTMNNEFYKIMSEEINDRIEAEGDRMVMRDPALDAGR